MRSVKEVIVVEGRYDKNTLSQVVDAVILETSGFGIFNDREKRKLFLKLAEKRGLIVLTDSDGAGFLIRNYIRSCVPSQWVKHAYIPDIYGKERRKKEASKEGKLGVEGMNPQVLLDALERAGAHFLDEPERSGCGPSITKADLYAKGLSGRPDSKAARALLLKKLDLPERLTSDGLLDVLNALMSREAFFSMSLTDLPDRPER